MSVVEVIAQLEGQPDILEANWCLPPYAAQLLYLLAKTSGAKAICEIGTSIGYSTLWLAKAAQENSGRVETIDYYTSRQEQARQHIQHAQLEPYVSFHQGAALDILGQFQQQNKRFDFVFIDAAKKEYATYLEHLTPLLNRDGLLVADNTQSHREAMADFITAIQQHPQYFTVDLPTPTGQIIAQKRS